MNFKFHHILAVLAMILVSLTSAFKLFAVNPYPHLSQECSDNPQTPCLTISSFASSHNVSNTNTLILVILARRNYHILDTELVIRNASHLLFLSAYLTTITCRGAGKIIFENIEHVKITNIEFVGCGDISVSSVTQFELEGSYFDGRGANSDTGIIFNQVSSVTIVRSVFTSCVVDDPKKRVHKKGGAITIFQSRALIVDTLFEHNKVALLRANSGGAVYAWKSDVTFENCTFINNTIQHLGGGALFARRSNITITRNCTFSGNTMDSGFGGSALHARRSYVFIDDAKFVKNRLNFNGGNDYGGMVVIRESISVINNSVFYDNKGIGILVTAGNSGYLCIVSIYNSNFSKNPGALEVSGTNLNIVNCSFIDNHALSPGGAISAHNQLEDFWDTTTSITVQKSVFINNSARTHGGAISVARINHLNLTDCTFINNRAPGFGAAMYISNTPFTSSESLMIQGHRGDMNVVYVIQSAMKISGNTTISNNCGSFFVINSEITFNGLIGFVDNGRDGCKRISNGYIEGGAVTSFQSHLTFDGNTLFSGNEAKNGGAISATESVLSMGEGGEMTISHNRALLSGGGIYAYQSELNFLGRSIIANNTAQNGGGGIFAISATTRLLKGRLNFQSNHANLGGGIFLESSAKLYIVKSRHELICKIGQTDCTQEHWLRLEFTKNLANYGGAIYVNDDTSSSTCASTPDTPLTASSECFFQSLAFYHRTDNIHNNFRGNGINTKNTFFVNNTASIVGDTLYGGLLDRCLVSQLGEKSHALIPLDIFETSDINSHDISSSPARVCLCDGEQPDCTYEPPAIHARKGETFTLSAVAVDQVGKPLPSSVHSLLKQQGGAFKEGQLIQNTSGVCTKLEYNIFSPHDTEELLLFAEGPCRDIGVSQRSVNVTFLPCTCPIGFQPSTSLTNCECVCDPALKPYITNCSIETESVIREGDFWITFVSDNVTNTSEGSIYIHPQCPLDYCVSSAMEVSINLNNPSGADSQCAFNRSGTLCGSCKEGLSLTLGSSRCMACSNYWLVLLIPFAIAGISLVTVLLVLNLTVAVGTINGLIFYANVVITNKAIFIPLGTPNIMNVFIAWLNLDLGIETCFFNGMNALTKTWLQLVFPVYIIFLVAMIIIVAEHSQRFSRLISYKNPVATLATLILLSYSKFLRTIINVLLSTTLEYTGRVWLFDANVSYLSGKHIPLFLIGIIVFFAGLLYTIVLFLGQWVMQCPNRKYLNIFRNTKLNSFFEAYSAPYKTKHYYWTGLLLLARISLYLISALNSSPRVNLLSITIVVTGLLLIKQLSGNIYKQWVVDVLESSFLFYLIVFSNATLYLYDVGANHKYQHYLANTITALIIITSALILVYHTYKYVLLKSSCGQRIKTKIKRIILWYQNTVVGNLLPLQKKKKTPVFQRTLDLFENDSPMAVSQEPNNEILVTQSVIAVSRDDIPLSKLLGHDCKVPDSVHSYSMNLHTV